MLENAASSFLLPWRIHAQARKHKGKRRRRRRRWKAQHTVPCRIIAANNCFSAPKNWTCISVNLGLSTCIGMNRFTKQFLLNATFFQCCWFCLLNGLYSILPGCGILTKLERDPAYFSFKGEPSFQTQHCIQKNLQVQNSTTQPTD